jgi:hypothetical protein
MDGNSAGSLRDFTGTSFSAKIFIENDSDPAPKNVSVVQAVWHLVTCKFLTYGNTARDIRAQLLQEQLNVALVSALFLTISIPAMLWITELEQYGWSEFHRSLLGVSLCMSTANFAIAVVFAVLYALAIQECVDDCELRRFTALMGRYFQLSSISFILGVIILGGFSWTMWAYVTFRFDWFLGLSITYIALNTFVCVFTGLIVMIKKLYKAKEGRCGEVIITREQLSKAITAYLGTLMHKDLADIEKFKEFVFYETHALDFSAQTRARLRTEWNKAMKDALQDEYEHESGLSEYEDDIIKWAEARK